MDQITYEKYITSICDGVRNAPKNWRRGQAVFNAIDGEYGNVARKVQMEDGIDCFYDNTRVDDFIAACWKRISNNGMEPKWLYRLEYKDDTCGLWYNGTGGWCFENGIGALDDTCKTKTLPMDYDQRYKQDGRDWFSSCSHKEDLMHWYSKEDAKTLLEHGFVFTRYLATEYHEYDLETVFIKETALKREVIDFFELFGND